MLDGFSATLRITCSVCPCRNLVALCLFPLSDFFDTSTCTGLMHHFGRPDCVRADPGTALLWYERAALGGNSQARALIRQLLPRHLLASWTLALRGDATAQRACAQAMARGWFAAAPPTLVAAAQLAVAAQSLRRNSSLGSGNCLGSLDSSLGPSGIGALSAAVVRPHAHIEFEWYQRAMLQSALALEWPKLIVSAGSLADGSGSGSGGNGALVRSAPPSLLANYSLAHTRALATVVVESEPRDFDIVTADGLVYGPGGSDTTAALCSVPQLMLLYARFLSVSRLVSLRPATAAVAFNSTSALATSSSTPSLAISSSTAVLALPPTAHELAPVRPVRPVSRASASSASALSGEFDPHIVVPTVFPSSSGTGSAQGELAGYGSDTDAAAASASAGSGAYGHVRKGLTAAALADVERAAELAALAADSKRLFASLEGSLTVVASRPGTANHHRQQHQQHYHHQMQGHVASTLPHSESTASLSSTAVSPSPVPVSAPLDVPLHLQSHIDIAMYDAQHEQALVSMVDRGSSAARSAWTLSALLLAGTSTSVALAMKTAQQQLQQQQGLTSLETGGGGLFHVEYVWSQCSTHLRARLMQIPCVVSQSHSHALSSAFPHVEPSADATLLSSPPDFSLYVPFAPSALLVSRAAVAPAPAQSAHSAWTSTVLRLAALWYRRPARADAADAAVDTAAGAQDNSSSNDNSSGAAPHISTDAVRAFALYHAAAAFGSVAALRHIGLAFMHGIQQPAGHSTSLVSSSSLSSSSSSSSPVPAAWTAVFGARASVALDAVLRPHAVLATEWLAEAAAAGDARYENGMDGDDELCGLYCVVCIHPRVVNLDCEYYFSLSLCAYLVLCSHCHRPASARSELDTLLSPAFATVYLDALRGVAEAQFLLALMYDVGPDMLHAELASLAQPSSSAASPASASSSHRFVRVGAAEGAPAYVNERSQRRLAQKGPSGSGGKSEAHHSHARRGSMPDLASIPATVTKPTSPAASANESSSSSSSSLPMPARSSLSPPPRRPSNHARTASTNSTYRSPSPLAAPAAHIEAPFLLASSSSPSSAPVPASAPLSFASPCAGAVRFAPAAWLWYQRAAAAGHTGALNNVGVLLATTRAHARDERACAARNAAAFGFPSELASGNGSALESGVNANNANANANPYARADLNAAAKKWHDVCARGSSDATNATAAHSVGGPLAAAMFNLGLLFELRANHGAAAVAASASAASSPALSPAPPLESSAATIVVATTASDASTPPVEPAGSSATEPVSEPASAPVPAPAPAPAPATNLVDLQQQQLAQRKADLVLAGDWFQAAADAGLGSAWLACARLRRALDAIRGDEEEGLLAPLMDRWLLANDTAAAFELGTMFLEGRAPVTHNAERALMWFARAAMETAELPPSSSSSSSLVDGRAHPAAPVRIGWDGLDDDADDDDDVDDEHASDPFSSSSRSPHRHQSQHQLQHNHRRSVPVPVDHPSVPRHVGACLQLGRMRDEGNGCKADAAAAARAYRWAAARFPRVAAQSAAAAESSDGLAASASASDTAVYAATAARMLGLMFHVGRHSDASSSSSSSTSPSPVAKSPHPRRSSPTASPRSSSSSSSASTAGTMAANPCLGVRWMTRAAARGDGIAQRLLAEWMPHEVRIRGKV